MKNRVLLENYYLPGDLERQIGTFVEYYNNQRYHESLGNVTPADVYFGREKIHHQRKERIKKLTIQSRRLQHQKQAAHNQTHNWTRDYASNRHSCPILFDDGQIK